MYNRALIRNESLLNDGFPENRATYQSFILNNYHRHLGIQLAHELQTSRQ